MPEFIMKWFGWNCKWEYIETLSEGGDNNKIYNLYKDTNKNGIERFKKVLVNYSFSSFNSNRKLIGYEKNKK